MRAAPSPPRTAAWPAEIVIAIDCHPRKGGQFIDAGLVVMK
jgi:hypothetical protein